MRARFEYGLAELPGVGARVAVEFDVEALVRDVPRNAVRSGRERTLLLRPGRLGSPNLIGLAK